MLQEYNAQHMKDSGDYSFQASSFYKKMDYKQLLRIVPDFKDYDQYYFILFILK